MELKSLMSLMRHIHPTADLRQRRKSAAVCSNNSVQASLAATYTFVLLAEGIALAHVLQHIPGNIKRE